jgi:choline dehydrogenase-like flavoprotein
LASRLSEDPRVTVAVIEAGPEDRHAAIHMPRGFPKVYQHPDLLWRYDVKVGGGSNRDELWIRGRTLGGSSSVNGMVYVRGQPQDYDGWRDMGLTEWGWPQMLAAFKAMENHELGEDEMRGSGGPLDISAFPGTQPLAEAFIEAAGELGLPRRDDLNRDANEGAGYYFRTIHRGRRNSSAKAFLAPARKRKNLTVFTGLTIDRLVFNGPRATAVIGRRSGEAVLIQGREIVVSAGVLNSPLLLQRSGIGPAPLLQRLGIPVVADRREVGRNLRDHRGTAGVQLRVNGESLNRAFSGVNLAINVIRQQLFGMGPLADGAFEAGAFFRTRPDLDRPDGQLFMGAFSVDGSKSFTETVLERDHGMMIGGYFMRPYSAGAIEISSLDPFSEPVIDANVLGDPRDHEPSIGVFKFARLFAATKALQRYGAIEIVPGIDFTNDDEILAYIRQTSQPGIHATGTCRMGVDAEAVLDGRLRVKGVEGLRVVDCSAMPTQVSGNTNGPAMAFAHHAANLIIEDCAGIR